MKKQGYMFVISEDKTWFNFMKHKPTKYERGNLHYTEYLDKFNIDLNDYWIMKKSGNFRLIEVDEFEKWSGIICFNKKLLSKEHIDKWLNFLYKDLKISIPYLNKPLPPKYVYDKIKIVEWDIE